MISVQEKELLGCPDPASVVISTICLRMRRAVSFNCSIDCPVVDEVAVAGMILKLSLVRPRPDASTTLGGRGRESGRGSMGPPATGGADRGPASGSCGTIRRDFRPPRECRGGGQPAPGLGCA